MIKISLYNIKTEIEKMFLRDAAESETGIIKQLSNKNCQKQNFDLLSVFPRLQSFLYPNGKFCRTNLEKLLLADKMTMEEYIERFQSEFDDNKDRKEKKLLLKEIFRYENFSKRKVAIKIQEKLNISVCPYCNRNYITASGKSGIRATFDHYFPKSKYPYLALSLYNLVPCCYQCNTLKSDLDTYETSILYPYEDEFGYDTTFYFKENNEKAFATVWGGSSDEFSIKINIGDSSKEEVIKKQNERLHILELYDTHKDLIRKIILHNKIRSDEYIRTLQKQFPELHLIDKNIWNLVYMNNIEKEDWKDNSLSKLIHDIHWQINGANTPN